MIKEQLKKLFQDYDRDVQRVIAEVIKFEQQNITRDRPNFKNEIKDIISNVVKDEN